MEGSSEKSPELEWWRPRRGRLLRRRLYHQVIELRHKRAFVWSGIVTERLGAFHKDLVLISTFRVGNCASSFFVTSAMLAGSSIFSSSEAIPGFALVVASRWLLRRPEMMI